MGAQFTLLGWWPHWEAEGALDSWGNLVPLTEPSELEVKGGAQSELKTSVPWVSELRQVPRVV